MTSFPSLLQLSDTLDLSSLVVAQGKHLSLLLSSGSLRGGGRFTTLIVLCKVRERKELSMQSKLFLRKGIRLCRSSSPLFVLVSLTGSVCCYQGYGDCVCCIIYCFLHQSQTVAGKAQSLSFWGLERVLAANVNSMTRTSFLESKEVPNRSMFN